MNALDIPRPPREARVPETRRHIASIPLPSGPKTRARIALLTRANRKVEHRVPNVIATSLPKAIGF